MGTCASRCHGDNKDTGVPALADLNHDVTGHAQIKPAEDHGSSSADLLRSSSYRTALVKKAGISTATSTSFHDNPETKAELKTPMVAYELPDEEDLATCKVVLLLGRPGAGKKTQARLLRTHLGLASLSVVELAKTEAHQHQTTTGFDALRAISGGRRVPIPLAVYLLTKAIMVQGNTNGYLLTDFPATEDEAAYLTAAGVHPTCVVSLDCSAATAAARSAEVHGAAVSLSPAFVARTKAYTVPAGIYPGRSVVSAVSVDSTAVDTDSTIVSVDCEAKIGEVSTALVTLLRSKLAPARPTASRTGHVKPTASSTKSDVAASSPAKKAEDPSDQIAAVPGLEQTGPTSAQSEPDAGPADPDNGSGGCGRTGSSGDSVTVLEQSTATDGPVADAAEVTPVDPTLATFFNAIKYLSGEISLGEEGLFRVSGSKVDVDRFFAKMTAPDKTGPVDLSPILDPNVVSGVFKKLVGHYRLPLDDDSAAGLAKGLSAADPTEAVAKAVGALPEDRRSLLTATCALLTKVAASEKTKMSVATLAIAFGRTLFPGLDGGNVQSLMEALC